jgi:glutamate synthase (NADPH/NADH) small chain
LKENLPEIKLKSIYEIMVEIGPPNPIKVEDWVFSLHDSCTARWEKNLQDSVRGLIKKLNYEIEEVEYSRDKARCCGMGGMIPFVDFELAAKITKKRVNEFHFDIITYCAACREAFALEKPSIHILDLIFNPDWKKTRLNYPKTGKKRRETQSRTKAILMNLTANGIKENMLIENGRADGDL